MGYTFRKSFFLSIILLFTTSIKEAIGASAYLSKRKLANQAEIDLGAKKFSYPDTALNSLESDTMPPAYCGDLRYRIYIWDFFAIGPTLEFCKASYKGGKNSTIKTAETTTSGGTLDFIFSAPMKQRVIGGPFAGQSLELGFGLGLGFYSASFHRDYSDGTKSFDEKASGPAGILLTYADFGTDQWGVRVNVTIQKFQLSKIDTDHPKFTTPLGKDAASNSQDAVKLDLGVRFAF